jgi:ketosteroid isomerase-like protein
MAEGSYIVRPSGNPLTKDEEAAMRASEDIVMEKEELLEINDVDVMGDMATATFTVHQRFAYKGTPQDDVSVMLVILKRDKGSGAWKLTGGSRSQGRSPDDPKPAFP